MSAPNRDTATPSCDCSGVPTPAQTAPYDEIMPLVDLRIERAVRDTRHALRADLADLGLKVANAQLQSTKEHAQVQSALASLTGQIAALAGLPERVSQLERNDDIAAALHKTMWKIGGFVVAAVGAFSGIVILLLS